MASQSVRIAASLDDVSCYWSGSAWVYGATGGDTIGNYLSSCLKIGCGLRFTGWTIPPGSIITGAYMIFRPPSSNSATVVRSYFKAERSVNGAQISSLSNYQSRRDSSAWGGDESAVFDAQKVAWDSLGAWTTGNDYGTDGTGSMPNVNTAFIAMIQAVIDQAGWTGASGGNTIVIFWDDHEARGTQTAGVTRQATSYDYDETPSVAPILYLTWTERTQLHTEAASSVTATAARLNGHVTHDGAQTVDYVGFVYGKVSEPTNPGDVDPNTTPGNYTDYWKSASGDYGENPFYTDLSGLDSMTTYYYRACSHNAAGWTYGDEVSFTTGFTHRISNTGTVGVKKGGVKLQAARIYIVNMVTETVAKELTDEDGLYEHDTYGYEDLVPKFCAFCVWSDLATLTTALTGSNNDLKFTAKETDANHWYPGTFGHNLSLEYRNPNMNSSALAVLARATLGDLCTNGCFVTDYSGWIAVDSTITKVSEQKKIGLYSLKVVTTANSGYTYFPVTSYSGYASKTLTGGMWVYIPTASHGTWTVKMTDGVGTTSSAAITARDTWTFVKVTRTIDTTPTHLRLHLDCASGDTGDIGYVSGVDWQVAADISGYTWHDIIVKLATSAGGVITTIASEIHTAIEAQTDANKMVGVENAVGDDGTGTVTAMARTNLSGGAYYSDVAHTFITPAEIT